MQLNSVEGTHFVVYLETWCLEEVFIHSTDGLQRGVLDFHPDTFVVFLLLLVRSHQRQQKLQILTAELDDCPIDIDISLGTAFQ